MKPFGQQKVEQTGAQFNSLRRLFHKHQYLTKQSFRKRNLNICFKKELYSIINFSDVAKVWK